MVEVNGREVKDCSNCQLPHTESGYDYIVSKLAGDDFPTGINIYNVEDWMLRFDCVARKKL